MNDHAGKKISDSGAHNAYVKTAGEILKRFNAI